MSERVDDHLYEVHLAETDKATSPWQHAGNFESLEAARVHAVHLVTDTTARVARIMHVVEYYSKPD
jgi:hypothetical protein